MVFFTLGKFWGVGGLTEGSYSKITSFSAFLTTHLYLTPRPLWQWGLEISNHLLDLSSFSNLFLFIKCENNFYYKKVFMTIRCIFKECFPTIILCTKRILISHITQTVIYSNIFLNCWNINYVIFDTFLNQYGSIKKVVLSGRFSKYFVTIGL